MIQLFRYPMAPNGAAVDFGCQSLAGRHSETDILKTSFCTMCAAAIASLQKADR